MLVLMKDLRNSAGTSRLSLFFCVFWKPNFWHNLGLWESGGRKKNKINNKKKKWVSSKDLRLCCHSYSLVYSSTDFQAAEYEKIYTKLKATQANKFSVPILSLRDVTILSRDWHFAILESKMFFICSKNTFSFLLYLPLRTF